VIHPPFVGGTARLRQRMGAVLLIAALLWAQTLGLMHRQVHAHGWGGLVAEATPLARADAPSVSEWLRALPVHDAWGACLLFDHLSQADALGQALPLLRLPSAPPQAVTPPAAAPAPCQGLALFEARAPPFHAEV